MRRLFIAFVVASLPTIGVVTVGASEANIMRCLGSNMSGHRTHDHWHVWTGTSAGKWYDTGREC